MKLSRNWKQVVRKAWSVRLMLAAGLLTGGEAVINVVGVDWVSPWLPPWVRLLFILAVIGGATVARVVYQKSVYDAKDD